MTGNRRGTFRANAFTFGALRFAGGEIACLTWDATETGAQIEVEAPEAVPERFVLSLREGAPSREAAVVWRRGRRIGVTFAP